MLFLRYLLLFTGFGLFIGAAAILVYDLYVIFKGREPGPGSPEQPARPHSVPDAPRTWHWHAAQKIALMGVAPVLLGLSLAVIPSGSAGVRISQISGASPRTLYPGVHWIVPLVDRIEVYNIRDGIFSTVLGEDPKKNPDALRVQTKEGLPVGLAITVRYRLDPSKLSYIYTNLPQPVESEIVPPVVATAFRELAPNYMVKEMFADRREEIRRTAAGAIAQRLARDGMVVKEVMLRDIQLPAEYAKSLEGLLLKEQENERLSVELEVKLKQVRQAELEAEAQKAREVKQAEGQAQITVLQAKAQADAMQYTLPLKEKQIQQSKLEAEARKEATVKNAEAMAEAKVIDSKAELEKRKLMADSDDYRIRHVAQADAEKMRLEAEILKQNPLLIQKIIAEKLSDKVQIMMVPNDGKFFFANDVLKGMTGQ
jgi:regulator of protease activity HflC (stomatin/prohibitin superfamily)